MTIDKDTQHLIEKGLLIAAFTLILILRPSVVPQLQQAVHDAAPIVSAIGAR